MCGVLPVDDFREQEIGESFPLGKDGAIFDGRSEHLNVLRTAHSDAVVRVLCARIDRSHDDEHVLELRPDALRGERERARLLKDDRHYVVTDVALPKELLTIVRGEREHRRDVKHYLAILVFRVDRV